LPIAFGNMTGGWLFGVLFFVMLVFAALTSSISLIEPAVAWLVEHKGMNRDKACIWSGLVAWLLGLELFFHLMSGLNSRFSTEPFFNCWII